MLHRIVNVLAPYVDMARPVDELEIRNFARELNIPLRQDHLRFMMRFGYEPGRRLNVFDRYGGDFGFDIFKRIYLENAWDMKPPEACVYFGSDFIGTSFCIDESGAIHEYETGEKYGLVYTSIDSFLLDCLLTVYEDTAFAQKVVDRDVCEQSIERFRSSNAHCKLTESRRYREQNNKPKVDAEYYFRDGQLIVLYPTGIVTLSGGILDKLNS